MMFREIILCIRDLDFYTREQLEEYISYFEDADILKAYLREHSKKENNKLLMRIKSRVGSNPVIPDYNASPKIVKLEYLLSKNIREGMTLGVVSGSFDLLHIGHLMGMVYSKHFLEQYKNPKLCALTLSDENIRAKKGETRPILNLNERLEMISNVGCVDYVIPLKEPNCLVALGKIKPDYFFKNTADKSQDIVRTEMDLVESYDGSVVIFPPEQGRGKSTTHIIGEVLEKLMREW